MQQIGLDATLNNVPDFTSGINTMNRAVDSFASNSMSAGKEFGGGFGEVVTGALRKVGELAVDALLKAGRAVADFTKDSIKLAGDFQSGMLEFQSVAGKDIDTKGLEEFHDLFLQIGKDLPVSTSEVQQAAIEMVKGGIDPAIIAAGGLKKNIQFASAAMKGDLVKAAEISSKILGGWSKANATAAEKTDFLAHSQDMLAKAANASSTDVEGLSRGIFQSQGIAKTAGVSFDDLTTTLALLAPRFASSAEAGTSVKNMIARLQPTTDPAIVAMTRLGLYTEKTGSAFYDAQGNFVGFEQASQLLQNSLQGLTKEQQAAALQTIFGNDAMSAAAALADGGGEAYAIMAQKLNDANGVVESAALKQQGFNTSLDNAKGSIETLQIRIGEALLPMLGTLLDDYITPGINRITGFAESFLKMAPAIAASDDPIQTFLNALKIAAPELLDTIGRVEAAKDAFVDFATPIAAVVIPAVQEFIGFVQTNVLPALGDLATWLKTNLPIAAQTAADFWKTTLQPALAAIGGFITANVIPALSDVAVWLKTNIPVAAQATVDFWNSTLLPAIQGFTSFLKTSVFPTLSEVYVWFKTTIPVAAQATADFWNGILLPALTKVNDYVHGTIFPTFADLADKYLKNVTKASGDFSDSWNTTVFPALQKVGNYIGQQTAQQWAQFNVWVALVQKTGELFMAFWNNILWPGLKGVGEYISTHLGPFFSDFGTELNTQVGPALKGITDWLGKVSGGFDGTSKAIQDNIKWLNDLASGIRELKLPSWLTPGSPTPWEIALLGIGKALSALPGALSGMQEGISDVGDQIADTFQSTDLVDVLEGLGEDIMGGFIHGIRNAWGGVEDIINSTADSVESAFQSAFEAHSAAQRMIPIGEDVSLGIMEGIKSAWPAITDQIGSLTTDLVDSMQGIGDRINDAIADSFGSTASIDRQIAKNLDRFKDVLPQYQQYTQGALNEAQLQAREFADPAQGAKFFKMRSDQILEYAKLQKDLDEAATQDDKDRIQAQMLLINQAQTAEIAQFNATKAAASPMLDIAAAIKKMLDSIGAVTRDDPRAGLVDQLQALWTQLQTPVSTVRTPYNPGATNNSTAYNLSMPIYTNQSPSVLQDSMAILGAGTFI